MTTDHESRAMFRSTDPDAIALWNRICDEHDSAQRAAVAFLEGMGVKLVHPDDGWVTRKADGSGSFTLSWYARLDLHPEVGDLMAFGNPGELSLHRSEGTVHNPREEVGSLSARSGYRIVRCTAVERRSSVLGFHQDFEYEPAGYWPEPPPRRWWERLLGRHELVRAIR